MPPPTRAPHLAIVEVLAQTIERARDLCWEARLAASQAAAQVAKSRREKSERNRWRAVWSRSASRDEPLVVVCCAYCARVRTSDGEWGAIPASLSQAIHQSFAVRLSHGFCPDCLARHFPADTESDRWSTPGE
jgi:hypothetical protein